MLIVDGEILRLDLVDFLTKVRLVSRSVPAAVSTAVTASVAAAISAAVTASVTAAISAAVTASVTAAISATAVSTPVGPLPAILTGAALGCRILLLFRVPFV
jgi:hypothetical protein